MWEWNPEPDKLERLEPTMSLILHTLSSIYSLAFALNYLQKGIMQKSKSKCFLEHSIFEFPQKIEQIPWPGNYEELQKERKGVTIGQHLKDKAPEEISGPGSYKVKSHIVEGPHIQFEY